MRDLRAGQRPKDWVNDGTNVATDLAASHTPTPPEVDQPVGTAPARVAPAQQDRIARELPPLTPPQQYHVQFSALDEHVKLVERAKQLLAREAPGIGLAELHLQAMRIFVKALEKEKLRKKAPSQPSSESAAAKPTSQPPRTQKRGDGGDDAAAVIPTKERERISPPAGRSRYIPVAERRAVLERDESRCSYVDEAGVRCRETSCLEFHHILAFANGGENVAANLTLRCAAHNTLAAEQEFGRERVQQARDGARHESLIQQDGQRPR